MPPAQNAILIRLSQTASDALKSLLENKHLYQSVNINPANIAKEQIEQETYGDVKQSLYHWSANDLPKMRFTLAQQQSSAVARGASQATLTLTLPHPGLYCGKCERREAFAPVWFQEVSNEISLQMAAGVSKQIALPGGFQMFFLLYQCQHCLGTPEGFLVRRTGWNLGLHGRSPIESVELPAFLPKSESWLYRDAVIAFNSGKILAGLFYLRTFIEQFARRVTGRTGRVRGDEILDEYYKALPSPTKEQMPSLREWYDRLSEALHSASQDAALFEDAKREIERHFDFRRLFKIPEGKPTEVPAARPASDGAESKTAS
jgi:hypothetical protein